MKNLPEQSMSNEKRIELIRWLIDSYDQRKASVANRATILLSADALVLTATTILIDNLKLSAGKYNSLEQLFLVAGCAIALLLLLASMAVATSGMANIWRTHRQHNFKAPSRLYFYPRETFEQLVNFNTFADSIKNISEEEFETVALGHLWTITKEYGDRYVRLRLATRLLCIGIFPFMLAVGIVLHHSL